ncbi:hypothetical protein AYL99_00782 [Fonsecaea erecta]|uniref:Uncharacterized protein n=1 Tax=Fonsecaea erecta TaxID=1367422 RepID=A0A178ZY68_9EURO|nr:hypothetical protein AYL99_00782 [Fonsecaea erecta]OAP64810.1 hypothetical protein AYL99_00782 [Fonsecaea erecta]
MDRFTRTKEYYLQGRHRCRQPETPPTSQSADFVFDFDFKDSKLDLSFDVGNSVDQSDRTVRHQIDPSESIGVALSDGPYQQHGGLNCSPAIEDRRHCQKHRNEPISSIPDIPTETHIKFSSRCEQPSTNLPLCSIYSKAWRERVRRTITPPQQTLDHVSADRAAPFSEETSSELIESESTGPKSGNEADQESPPPPSPPPPPSSPPESCPEDVHEANERRNLLAGIPYEHNTKENGKRFSKIGEWLLRPKRRWDARVALCSPSTSVETMSSRTPTPSPSSSQDTSNQHHLRQNLCVVEATPTLSLQTPDGTTITVRTIIADVAPTAIALQVFSLLTMVSSYLPRMRIVVVTSAIRPHLAQCVTSLVDLERPETDLNGPILGRLHIGARDLEAQADGHSAMKMTEEGKDSSKEHAGRVIEDLSIAQRKQESKEFMEAATPRGLGEGRQNPITSLPQQPSPTSHSTQQSHPSSHQSTASRPPVESEKQPEQGDGPRQGASQAEPSQPQLDPNFPYGSSIRVLLGDGRVVSMSQYKTLQEKRAGKKKAAAPRGESTGIKSMFAALSSKKKTQKSPASLQRAVLSTKASPRRETSTLQQQGPGDKAQSEKPAWARSSAEEPLHAADPESQSSSPFGATANGKQVAKSPNVQAGEHSAANTIPGPSTRQRPSPVSDLSTSRQQGSPTATASSPQSLSSTSTSVIPAGRTSDVPGPAASQQSTTATTVPAVSSVDPPPPSLLPPSSDNQRSTARSTPDTTTAQETEARKDGASYPLAQVETQEEEEEPTWSFANLKL